MQKKKKNEITFSVVSSTDIIICFRCDDKFYFEDEEFDFKVILLGLDGGIKYESSTVEPAQVYYDLIDRMPMRRSQMRKRIKNGGR